MQSKAIFYPAIDLIAPHDIRAIHQYTTTNAIDIFTLRQGPCGRCDEEEDAEKINEFFFFFVYECVWARNAWVIKASSFRIAYHHLLSGARNAYD